MLKYKQNRKRQAELREDVAQAGASRLIKCKREHTDDCFRGLDSDSGRTELCRVALV